jgi:hypothetical protein
MVRNNTPMPDWQRPVMAVRRRREEHGPHRQDGPCGGPSRARCVGVWADASRWAALNEQRLTSPAFEAALPWTVESARGPSMRRRSGLCRVA